MASTSKTSVLIAGAGPVGLALACELGLRGIDCVLVEKRDGSINLPRMSAVSARNMEFCRRWGIAEAVRTAVWPESHAMDFLYLDTLRGRELARSRLPSLAQWGKLEFTPEGGVHCPQIYFDRILSDRVKTLPSVKLRYETKLDSFEDDGEQVHARITDVASDVTETIVAQYLVGCDGPAGVVREALGISLGGLSVVSDSVNIFFRSPELASWHDKGWARMYRMIDATGCWSELIPIDGKELWRLTVFDDARAMDDPHAALVRMAGGEFPYEIISAMPWERRDFVAESYGHGRVHIAGDAAHQCSPTGGLGMHTGIEDAVNLAWKLAASIEGWGGPDLVASYPQERHPIAVRNVGIATRIYNQLAAIPGWRADEAGEAESAEDWRSQLGNYSISEKQKMDICYSDSEICVADSTGVVPEGAVRSGERAPHAWLADGRSTLDLFGHGFALLRFGDRAPDPAPLAVAAAARGVPIRVVTIEDQSVAERYGRNLVLVRPDGHVAWCGDACPQDADALVNRVRGAGAARHAAAAGSVTAVVEA